MRESATVILPTLGLKIYITVDMNQSKEEKIEEIRLRVKEDYGTYSFVIERIGSEEIDKII